uniref:G_PROTEIN_RECEP_F1_2 domain-containing protein n=1 Tax=Onchocerca volvulus TaxID=6282 RepID=A0A8R1Y1N3_ONCVO
MNLYCNIKNLLSTIMVARSCYVITLFLILSSNCQNSNTTSALDKINEHHTTTKYVAVSFITAFLLYGVVSNLLMTITFCVRGNIYSHAFILISSQLIISNFALFLPEMAIVLPELLRNDNISGVHQTTWVTHAFSFLKSFSIFSALHFTFLLTLNRFVIQILPKYNTFFESVWLYFLVTFEWLSVFAITMMDFYYCTTRCEVSSLRWRRNCTKQSKKSGDIFLSFRYAWITFLPVAIFIMYIAIFCSIRRKRHSVSNIDQKQGMYAGYMSNISSTRSCERVMLIQPALICGALESTILVFNFFPLLVLKIFDQKAIIPLGIFINCFSIFSRSVLPTVYFIYNKQARIIVKNFFLRLRLYIAIKQNTIVTSITIPLT